jgi:NADPH:quinone reductase-like Zn-dependent oxidoreductase
MIEQTVGEWLENNVVLDLEGIDRLNRYRPMLQIGGGLVTFFKGQRAAKMASTTRMSPMSHTSIKAIHSFSTRRRRSSIR